MAGEDRPDTDRACIVGGHQLLAVAVRGASLVAVQVAPDGAGSPAAVMLPLEDVQELTRWLAQWVREQPAPGEPF